MSEKYQKSGPVNVGRWTTSHVSPILPCQSSSFSGRASAQLCSWPALSHCHAVLQSTHLLLHIWKNCSRICMGSAGEKHELWSWVPIGLFVCFAHQQHLLFSDDASWSLLSLEKVLSCLNGVTVIFILFFSLPSSSCFSNGFLL